MNQNKFLAALGFSMRAGRCVSGDEACEKAVKSGKAKLVLVDKQASEKTLERWRGLCARTDLMIIETEQLGNAIGKPGRMVVVILDKGFSDMIADAFHAQ
jgi:ribosomal protein L7Ae-like RNA K-turn-binding protein